METLFGMGLVTGAAIGPVWLLDPRGSAVPHRVSPDDVRPELLRLERAIALAEAGIGHPGSTDDGEISDAAEALEAQRALLVDSAFAAACRRVVAIECVTAETAVERVLDRMEAALGPVSTPDALERMHALETVGERVLAALPGWRPPAPLAPPRGAIIVARDLDPEEAEEMARAGAAGFATERRAEGILQRAAVPHVTALDHLLSRVTPGQILLVDGDAGRVIIDPDPILVRRLLDPRPQPSP